MATLVVESAPPRGVVRDRGHVPTAAGVADFIRGTALLYPVQGSPIAQIKAPMRHDAPVARTGGKPAPAAGDRVAIPRELQP
jgi:hypothetical protein